jgi:hypothetical protein
MSDFVPTEQSDLPTRAERIAELEHALFEKWYSQASIGAKLLYWQRELDGRKATS